MSHLFLESLGWALLHLVWQGALVAAVLALGLRLLDARAATARYALACGALALMAALPVATGWSHLRAAQAQASLGTPERAVRLSSELPPVHRVVEVPEHRDVEREVLSTPSLLTQSLLERVLDFLALHLSTLVLAWGLGVALSSMRLLGGWTRVHRYVATASPAPAVWQQRLDGLAARLGMKGPIRLLQTGALDVPSVVGWFRPVVLLPLSALSGLPSQQLEMVLAHELAHIRRFDFAVNLAQMLVETLLFYHPAVWWVSHVIRIEREHCCDDIAAAASKSSLSYARALTALEELRVLTDLTGRHALSALGGSLSERIRRLVISPASRCSSRWVGGASVLTLMSGLAIAAPLTSAVLPGHVVAAAPSAPTAKVSTPPVPAAPAPAAQAAATTQARPARPAVVARADAKKPAPAQAPAEHEHHHGKAPGNDQARVGEDELTLDQYVELKLAGVTPEMVESVRAMGYTPTVENLVEFGHAEITPEYVRDMTARLGQKPSAEELVEMKHLDVTPAYIDALRALGFKNATAKEVTSARAVGVDEKYLSGLKAIGFTPDSLEQLTEMRAVDVTPEAINGLAKEGFKNLDAKTLVQLRSLDVTPEYVHEVRAAGLKELTVDDLVQLRSMDVNASFIRELREGGLDNLTARDLVRLRSGGVDAEFIRRMKHRNK